MRAPRLRPLRAERARGGRARPVARTVVPVLAVAAVLLVALLPSPYAIERPGPVFDTLGDAGTGRAGGPLIEIPGRATYPTTGRLDLLTVSVLGSPTGGPAWFDLALAWLDPAQSVVPQEAVFPAGQTQQQADTEGAQEMTASQQSAIAAALRELHDEVGSTVRIDQVGSGTAAAGRLRAGDVVLDYDGTPVTDACGLQTQVVDGGTRPSTITVLRDGARRTIDVTPRAAELTDGSTRPLLGVATSASFTFPFTVRIRLQDVGGPSAGMMFALGIIDKLTPGSLTGGRTVAGTGTICGDGTVGAIGGIRQKMVGARRAGATLFLAPAGNCDEVVGHVPAGLAVVAVDRLSDALAALRQVRSTGSTRGLPGCSAPVGSRG